MSPVLATLGIDQSFSRAYPLSESKPLLTKFAFVCLLRLSIFYTWPKAMCSSSLWTICVSCSFFSKINQFFLICKKSMSTIENSYLVIIYIVKYGIIYIGSIIKGARQTWNKGLTKILFLCQASASGTRLTGQGCLRRGQPPLGLTG